MADDQNLAETPHAIREMRKKQRLVQPMQILRNATSGGAPVHQVTLMSQGRSSYARFTKI